MAVTLRSADIAPNDRVEFIREAIWTGVLPDLESRGVEVGGRWCWAAPPGRPNGRRYIDSSP